MNLMADVVVIGGGAAGMAAAMAAAKAGVKTLLIERERKLGGVLDQCIHPGFGLHRYHAELTGPEFAHRLLNELETSGAEILTDATVLNITEERVLRVASPCRFLKVKAKAVVWATGARERPFGSLLIPGARPAGIFTAGLAQKLVNIYGLLPGKRALILGSGDIGLIMARRLFLEGMKVVAVAEIKPFPGGLLRNVVQCLEDFGIPLLLRHTVARVHGEKRLRGVTLIEVDETGRPLSGTEKFMEVDTLVVSVGLIPEVRLLEGLLPPEQIQRGLFVNSFFQTEVPWLFVAGNSLVVFDLVDTVAKVGEQAGYNAALFAKDVLPSARFVFVRPGKNVAIVVPHKLAIGFPTTLRLRVTRPFLQARVRISEVYERKHIGLRPAEMVEVELSSEDTAKLDPTAEVVVEVTPL